MGEWTKTVGHDALRVARLLEPWKEDHLHPNVALREALTELIDGAYLPAGWRMPGQRELADVLGVARGTVARVYSDLVTTDRLVARRGSGTFVRRAGGNRLGEGRLASVGERLAGIDLSTGALPGTDLVARVMGDVGRLLPEYLGDPGYYPAGLPDLRAALAAECSERAAPTSPDQVMVTAGSQQALWLIANALAGPGTLTIVEDPTYRGALEALAGAGGRLQGVPFTPGGLDLDLLEPALGAADLLYTQTSMHNPSGIHTSAARRRFIAELTNRAGTLVVDDQSQADLAWRRPTRMPGLDGLVDPDRVLVIGTFSKLFWGGIRVGWIRGPRQLIARLSELRRGYDLGSPVPDQLAALLLLQHTGNQRESRRIFLAAQYEKTAEVLDEVLPAWQWWPADGGSGLWIDTHQDAVLLAQRASARGVRLTAGPAFSPYDAHRTFVRLPVWLPTGQLAEAARIIADCD